MSTSVISCLILFIKIGYQHMKRQVTIPYTENRMDDGVYLEIR